MLTDPLSITVNAVAKSLVKINQDKYSSEYMLRTALDEFRLTIRHSSYTDKKRSVDIDRHSIQLVHTVFPVAPAVTSYVRKVYCVLENQQGDTLLDNAYAARAIFDYLTLSNIGKLQNFES